MKTLEKGAEKWIEYNLYKPHQLYNVSDNLKDNFARAQKYWKDDYARNILLYLDKVKREVLLSELEKELNIHKVALWRWVKRLSELNFIKFKKITGRKQIIIWSQIKIKTVSPVKPTLFRPNILSRPKNQDVINLIKELLNNSDRPLYLTEISEKTKIPLAKLQEVIALDAVSPEQKFEIIAVRLLKNKT